MTLARILAAIAVCSGAASSLNAADSLDGSYQPVLLDAEKSCGNLVTAQDEARRGDSHHQTLLIAWLAGYFTAYNGLQRDTYDIRGGTDMPSVMLWLENYCKSNPLDDLSVAANALIVKLHPNRLRTTPKGQ
jgi:hypothetical protein